MKLLQRKIEKCNILKTERDVHVNKLDDAILQEYQYV